MLMQGLASEFEIFTTADGSPTLIYRRADGYLEKMHHSGGAFNESMYIYHHGLCQALDQGILPRVVSVGLGLAYNELIAIAEFHRRGLSNWRLWSFEAIPYLQNGFIEWLKMNRDESELTRILDLASEKVSRHFHLPQLKELAAQAWFDGRLILRQSFPNDTTEVHDIGVVFYDAYSNKMSPELWQETELQKVLQKMLAPHALLCTYAATGSLNRVLKNLGFKLLTRPGFLGKRESTLAIR